MYETMDFARFSDVSVEKKIANAFQTDKPEGNINPAWWDLASMLKKLPKPGRDRSDSGDSDATLVVDSDEQDDFTKLVEELKKKASPPPTPLVRHISWAREPVKPPKAIFVTDYDTGKRSDLSVDSDYRGAPGPRGRAPSPYPGRPDRDTTSEEATPDTPGPPESFAGTNLRGQRKGSNSNVKPKASDSSASLRGDDSRQAGLNTPNPNSKDPNQPLTTATKPISQPRTPSPSPPRRKPTRSTCQCPPCAAATTPRRMAPPRSRPGWVATDPSRWDDGGASAPRLLWVAPAADPLVVDDAGTGVTRYVSSVRPERGRTAGRGHPVWAPSHSPAPGWKFAEGGGLWGVDAGELGEALKGVEKTKRRERERDTEMEVGRKKMKQGRSEAESGGRRRLAGSRRDNGSRDIRLSWRYAAMWEANCYTDMFTMHLG